MFDLLFDLQDSIRYQVANSAPIKLPLKPSSNLRKILPFLEPKISYATVLTTDETLLNIIQQIFDVPIDKTRIYSRLLVHFLRTFCKYEEIKHFLTAIEFSKLQKEWRKEIFLVNDLKYSY